MRLCVLGHSLIHIRQINFLREVASLGHEVLILAPGEWSEQRIGSTPWHSMGEGRYQIRTLKHFGGEDVYRFKFVGVEDVLEEFNPDVLYVMQEPNSIVALDCSRLPYKKALFTWENLPSNYTPLGNQVLKEYDLIVCGNGEAQELVSKHNTNIVVLPQVGVDTVHFQARPVKRDTSVAYIGRATQEKGVDKLLIAWPTARVLAWQDYLRLPWWYSQVKVIVTYSQDVESWREQAPPYVSVEGLCCRCAVVTSNAGSIPFWLGGKFATPCPGVKIVPQNDMAALKIAIGEAVASYKEDDIRGREWVEQYLSSRVIAQKLVEALNACA